MKIFQTNYYSMLTLKAWIIALNIITTEIEFLKNLSHDLSLFNMTTPSIEIVKLSYPKLFAIILMKKRVKGTNLLEFLFFVVLLLLNLLGKKLNIVHLLKEG